MDLVELQIFKTVAEQGGITRAATALHRVQSNVTTRVKQLEERLGAKLFHRQGRKLVLSSEGRLLLGYAERLLRLSTEAQAAVKGHTLHGLFRLGSLESTAAARLPPVLAAYHRAHPGVRLELVTGTSGALVDKVLRGDIEAAFVAEPFATKNLEMQHVFTEELVLITPRSHSRVTTAKELEQRVVLAFPTGCSYRRRFESWLGRASVVAERVMEYGSYHAIIACVAAGGGIAVVPRSVLRVVGAENQLAMHALPQQVSKARTMLVWPRGHQSAALAALRKALD
ncbi:MAG TPA: LysR substrate-binding domain-containing protein [Burkholderiales bacterium]|nr:LysR substrate-binding domain-containing protein [Burkholderiales bacterium]